MSAIGRTSRSKWRQVSYPRGNVPPQKATPSSRPIGQTLIWQEEVGSGVLNRELDRAVRGAHGVPLARRNHTRTRRFSRAGAGLRIAGHSPDEAPEYGLDARRARGGPGRTAEGDAQPLR